MAVTIKTLPKDDRPRERFLKQELNSISNEDLVSILLQSGPRGENVKLVAMKVLSLIESLDDIEQLTIERLKEIKGIGTVKAMTLLAALEFGRRMGTKKPELYQEKFKTAAMIYDYYKDTLATKKQEYFYGIYLDNQKRILKEKLLFIGTINYSTIHPREIFKEACLISASSIICIHNHPSGNVLPSEMDIIVTEQLVETGKILGIPVIDHIIISRKKYYSFFENHDI